MSMSMGDLLRTIGPACAPVPPKITMYLYFMFEEDVIEFSEVNHH